MVTPVGLSRDQLVPCGIDEGDAPTNRRVHHERPSDVDASPARWAVAIHGAARTRR